MTYHIPVMVEEVVSLISPNDGDTVLDCTIGGGGHAKCILDKYPNIIYYGIDQDRDALDYVAQNLKDDRLKLFHGNFSRASELIGNDKKVDRILLDIGVSSFQINEPSRGFSYMKEGPLDMRMDKTSSAFTAEQLINEYSEEQLSDIFYNYGDERKSRLIAAEICKRRKIKKITTTTELVELISKVIYGGFSQKQSSVKRVFQAVRIEVNGEIVILRKSIEALWSMLNKNGRILVITFHSLEDRIVKETFKTFLNNGDGLKLTKGALPPKWAEVKLNSRSKSARLRGLEKNK